MSTVLARDRSRDHWYSGDSRNSCDIQETRNVRPPGGPRDTLCASPPRADVQSLWRKRGWRPPSEYRQDFELSCRPAIFAGLVRLEIAACRSGEA